MIQKVIAAVDDLMEKVKVQLLGGGRIGCSEKKGFQALFKGKQSRIQSGAVTVGSSED